MKEGSEDNLYQVPPKVTDWTKRFRDRYVTYDKLHYWNRPLFSITVLIIGAVLAASGFIPLSLVAFWVTILCADDLVTDPIRRGMKHVSNFKRGHKKVKSVVGLAALVLGFLIGAAIGYFLLLTVPSAFTIIYGARSALFLSITSITIAYISMIALANIIKLSPIASWTLFFGVTLFTSPMIFGLGVDIVVASAVMGAFLASHLSKQCLRLYYKLTHGHSNADGYSMEVDSEARTKFFGVPTETIENLRSSLIKIISRIKTVSPWYRNLTGSRHRETNPYKDMLYMLLHTKKTADKYHISELINTSDNINSSHEFYKHGIHNALDAHYGESSFFTRARAVTNINANIYFNNAKGFAFKQRIHHLGADCGKARCFGDESFYEYQNAAKAFKQQMRQQQ